MTRRFFVKVYAPSKRALLKLQQYDLDLFQATAGLTEDKHCKIDGLLTMEQIEQLVMDGYRVLVEEESSKRASGRREIIEFQQWIEERKK